MTCRKMANAATKLSEIYEHKERIYLQSLFIFTGQRLVNSKKAKCALEGEIKFYKHRAVIQISASGSLTSASGPASQLLIMISVTLFRLLHTIIQLLEQMICYCSHIVMFFNSQWPIPAVNKDNVHIIWHAISGMLISCHAASASLTCPSASVCKMVHLASKSNIRSAHSKQHLQWSA